MKKNGRDFDGLKKRTTQMEHILIAMDAWLHGRAAANLTEGGDRYLKRDEGHYYICMGW
jgi:hypothetical protein